MTGRIYSTASWRDLRAAKLTRDPLCESCLRREVVEPATVVDHVQAIAAGGAALPSLDELMSMCAACHNAKTNAVDHPQSSGFRHALPGFDVEGNPIAGW